MKTFKTPKGTELPLRDFRGKDYLDVQYRVLWMREEHPDWGITTEIITHDDQKSIVRSTILDTAGKILAQGTKSETIGDFKDHLEKAETGATGRALALCGYGTQFAQELEEGERIVDGPREPRVKPNLQSVPHQDDIPNFTPSKSDVETCPKCAGRMMVSKYPNKVTGNLDWYCSKCKVSVPRTA